MKTHRDDLAFDGRATELRQTNRDGGVIASNPTLTKREYFAAMAMQGLAASGAEAWTHLCINDLSAQRTIPIEAVAMADRLIEELNKKKEVG